MNTTPRQDPKSRFSDWLLERRKRAESASVIVVADCYLADVSTRRMDKLVKALGIDSLSKSQISRMATYLDEHVEQFRHLPLDAAGLFTFVAADALTMQVHEGGRVVHGVVLLATEVNGDGHREVLGMRVVTSETEGSSIYSAPKTSNAGKAAIRPRKLDSSGQGDLLPSQHAGSRNSGRERGVAPGVNAIWRCAQLPMDSILLE